MFAGPSDETRVDVFRPASWRGLSDGDHRLLGLFVESLGTVPDELHTHVPVGLPDEIPAERIGGVSHRLYERLWPRRIDAVMRFGDVWWLVECKVGAAHYVLGQCLCYAMWWLWECQPLSLDRIVVATDRCDDGVRAVLEVCGIQVVEFV